MEGSRLQILKILQKNGKTSVNGLPGNMGLAVGTVRRHLDILQRDGLVNYVAIRKQTGRPENSFYLTDEGQEALPKGYTRLLGLIISELAVLRPEDIEDWGRDKLLGAVFRRLWSRKMKEVNHGRDGKAIRRRRVFAPAVSALRGHLKILVV